MFKRLTIVVVILIYSDSTTSQYDYQDSGDTQYRDSSNEYDQPSDYGGYPSDDYQPPNNGPEDNLYDQQPAFDYQDQEQGEGDESGCVGEGEECHSIDDCCQNLECVPVIEQDLRMECRRMRGQKSSPERVWNWDDQKAASSGRKKGRNSPYWQLLGNRPHSGSKPSSGGDSKDNLYKFQRSELHKPSLVEVAQILNSGLRRYFQHIQVSVVNCPDLTKPPFNQARSGLAGNEKIADIGGMHNVMPNAQLDKNFSMKKIAQLLGMTHRAFIIGAGGGPHHVVGHPNELMPSFAFDGNSKTSKSIYTKVGSKNESILLKTNSEEFSMMMNLFLSEGRPGRVLKVVAKNRIGKDNYLVAIRTLLKESFGDKPVGLGGVFLLKSGRARFHLNPPEFSKTPLPDMDAVSKWLRFYEMRSPMTCLSVLTSTDPGLQLRLDHTHCFSDHNEGGHYYWDTTPNEVEYEGYFNLAKEVYRFDPPAPVPAGRKTRPGTRQDTLPGTCPNSRPNARPNRSPGVGSSSSSSQVSNGNNQRQNQVHRVNLHAPRLREIAQILNTGLRRFYHHVQVSVVRCPDLKRHPFNLAQSGLGGGETIADVGGLANIRPPAEPQFDKRWSLLDISRIMGQSKPAYIIGATGGPYHVIGTFSEFIPSIALQGNSVQSKTRYARVWNERCFLGTTKTNDFSFTGNLYGSNGRTGPVLKVVVKNRRNDQNNVEQSFLAYIRRVLNERYGNKPVSLGGVFLVKRGKVLLHMMGPMPDRGRRQYNVSAPVTCLSVFHSHDPDMGVTPEHSHCFTTSGNSHCGGHYNYDLKPGPVEYEGYFNVAKQLFRIDRPQSQGRSQKMTEDDSD